MADIVPIRAAQVAICQSIGSDSVRVELASPESVSTINESAAKSLEPEPEPMVVMVMAMMAMMAMMAGSWPEPGASHLLGTMGQAGWRKNWLETGSSKY